MKYKIYCVLTCNISGNKIKSMFITKCDLCKKNIKKRPITVSFGFYERVELCEKCGLPILKFLKKKKLIKPEKKN